MARVAIALHNSIKEGGGNIATLNGDRISISPDNIQETHQTALSAKYIDRKNKLNSVYPKNSRYYYDKSSIIGYEEIDGAQPQ